MKLAMLFLAFMLVVTLVRAEGETAAGTQKLTDEDVRELIQDYTDFQTADGTNAPVS